MSRGTSGEENRRKKESIIGAPPVLKSRAKFRVGEFRSVRFFGISDEILVLLVNLGF